MIVTRPAAEVHSAADNDDNDNEDNGDVVCECHKLISQLYRQCGQRAVIKLSSTNLLSPHWGLGLWLWLPHMWLHGKVIRGFFHSTSAASTNGANLIASPSL